MNKIDKNWQDDHFSGMAGDTEAEHNTRRLLLREKELEKIKSREENNSFLKLCLFFVLVLGGITSAYYIGSQLTKPNTINENTSIVVNKNSVSNTHTTVNALETHNEKVNPVIIDHPVIRNTEVVVQPFPDVIESPVKVLSQETLDKIRHLDNGINIMSKEYNELEVTRLKCAWELQYNPGSAASRIRQIQDYYRMHPRMSAPELYNVNNQMANAQADYTNAQRLLKETTDRQSSLSARIDKAQAEKKFLMDSN